MRLGKISFSLAALTPAATLALADTKAQRRRKAAAAKAKAATKAKVGLFSGRRTSVKLFSKWSALS
jgi:hypothetical protein